MPHNRMDHPLHTALRTFSSTVTAKMSQLATGAPEDQLRAPFESFMAAMAEALGWHIVCTGETPLPHRLGRPDYAVHVNQLLAGYVELKAPGVGATATRLRTTTATSSNVSRPSRTFSTRTAMNGRSTGTEIPWTGSFGWRATLLPTATKPSRLRMRAPSKICSVIFFCGSRSFLPTAGEKLISRALPPCWRRYADCCATT